MNATSRKRWLHEPQRLLLRRALFQIHLWAGLGLGAYVVVICVSGSALVFRNELSDRAVTGPTIVEVSGPRLTDQELSDVAAGAFPGARVTNVWPAKQPNHAVEVWLQRKGKRITELFNPYTGAPLGAAEPAVIRWLVWL